MTAIARRCWVAALMAAVACSEQNGDPIAARDLAVRVEVANGSEEIGFGEPFELRVVRTFRADLRLEAFHDRDLAPLQLRSLGVEQRTGDGRIEEVHRFSARAFVLERVVVPPLRLLAVPKTGGAPLRAESSEVTLRVRTSLRAVGDREIEQSLELVPMPAASRPWLAVLSLLVVAVIAFWRWPRPRLVAAPTLPALLAPPLVDVRALAHAALLQLEASALGDREFAESLATVVREFAAAILGRGMSTRTTDELVADLGRCDAAARSSLLAAMTTCDLVKFACGELGPPRRLAVLASARAFLDGAKVQR